MRHLIRRATVNEPGGPHGVGGWLLLLCAVLIVWKPIRTGLVVSSALAALTLRGAPLGALIVVQVGVAAFGLASGLALIGRNGPALTMARMSLVAAAATDSFVYLTPYFPSNSLPGVERFQVVAGVLHAAGWLAYLARSRRVRNTFG